MLVEAATDKWIEMVSLGVGVLGCVAMGSLLPKAWAWMLKRFKATFSDAEMKQNQRINSVLEELRIRVGADRVSLLRFHNGGNYFDNTPIKKLSCTNVAVSPGISDEVSCRQALPISLFANFLPKLLSDKVDMLRVSDMAAGWDRAYCEVKHIAAMYGTQIKQEDRVVAVLTIHYCSMDNVESMAEIAPCELRNARSKIEYLLSMDCRKLLKDLN